MLPRPVTIGLTVLISTLWSANVVIGFIDPARANPYVNGIFAIVAGAVYALGHKHNRTDDQRDER